MIITEISITEYLLDRYQEPLIDKSEQELIDLSLPLLERVHTLEEKIIMLRQILDDINWEIVKEIIAEIATIN